MKEMMSIWLRLKVESVAVAVPEPNELSLPDELDMSSESDDDYNPGCLHGVYGVSEEGEVFMYVVEEERGVRVRRGRGVVG